MAETLARNIADTRKRLADTQAQVDAPFEYAERLAELVQRQQEIEDELDLTKNQAPGGLEPEPETGACSGGGSPVREVEVQEG